MQRGWMQLGCMQGHGSLTCRHAAVVQAQKHLRLQGKSRINNSAHQVTKCLGRKRVSLFGHDGAQLQGQAGGLGRKTQLPAWPCNRELRISASAAIAHLAPSSHPPHPAAVRASPCRVTRGDVSGFLPCPAHIPTPGVLPGSREPAGDARCHHGTEGWRQHPQLPTGCFWGGCPKEGVAAPHCTPRTWRACLATPPAHTQPRSTRPAWPPCVTPNRPDGVQAPGIPWPLTGRVTASKGQGLRMAGVKPAPGHIPPSPEMAPTGFGGCRSRGSLIVAVLRPRRAGTSLGGVAGCCGQPRPSVRAGCLSRCGAGDVELAGPEAMGGP